MLRQAMLSHAMLSHAMLSHTMLSQAYAMPVPKAQNQLVIIVMDGGLEKVRLNWLGKASIEWPKMKFKKAENGQEIIRSADKALLSFTVHQKGKPQPQHQKGRQSGTLNAGT
jgi:hypothetical protein